MSKIFKFNQTSKLILEDGLEELANSFEVPNVVPGKKSVLIGVDGGSTQTRVLVVDDKDGDNLEALSKVYAIPSTHSQIDTGESIEAQSDAIYSNMDSWIVNLIDAPNNVFDKVRVLRGTKCSDANRATVSISTSEQKIDATAFYVNLIDSVAYALIMKYNGKEMPNEFDVYAGISLRPDDLKGNLNEEKFLSRVLGTFVWKNEVELKINIKGCNVNSEPESEVKGYYSWVSEDVPETVLLLEGGGSSFGVEVLQNGVRQKNLSRTLEYGGRRLKQIIEDLFVEQNGGGVLTEANLEQAVTEGRITRGRSLIDCAKIVKTAKKEFAQQIFNDVKAQIFDRQNKIKIQDLTSVVYGGRIFRDGVYDEDGTGYSLATPITENFKVYNDTAEYLVLDKNMIPFGNLLSALNDFGGYVFNDQGESDSDVVEEYIDVEE